MGWQWHQLDHMQIISISPQTGDHASSTLWLNYLQAKCLLTPNQQCQGTEGNSNARTAWLHKAHNTADIATSVFQRLTSQSSNIFVCWRILGVWLTMQASRKKVYMLYDIQPDRSVTGGSWYTDQDFDSQFVDTLVMMCHRFLEQKVLVRILCADAVSTVMYLFTVSA